MKCPKCKHVDMGPTKMDQGLPAMGCRQCEGLFVSLLYYRDWSERFGVESLSHDCESQNNEELIADVENTHNAMSCPKCSRLMTKYRISSTRENRLDLCASCDEAWLDKGEWELLKSLNLGSQMPIVFTEQWQKKVRNQITEDQRRLRFVESLGEEVVAEADDVRKWLKQQSKRQQVLQYLAFE